MEVGLWGWYVGLYPRFPTASHLRRGSMKIEKRKGESVSLWMGASVDGERGGVSVDVHVVCV